MVLTDVTNQKEMAEQSSTGKNKTIKRRDSSKSGAWWPAFTCENFAPFTIHDDSKSTPVSRKISDPVEDSDKTPPDVKSEGFTSIKNKTANVPQDAEHQTTDQEKVVGVFSRRKKAPHSSSSSSSSDDSDQKCVSQKDNIDNAVSQKKKKRSRREAIGFPSAQGPSATATADSETSSCSSTSPHSSDSTASGETSSAPRKFDIKAAIENLPKADECPDVMSADQIADIDKLFDSLVPDYEPTVATAVSEPVKTPEKQKHPSRRKSERRKSKRRTSFILPCHMAQPEIPLLEQTDDNTPINEKKFTLPSSGENSTPASVTPVTRPSAAQEGKSKSDKSSKKGAKPKTKKRVKRPEVSESTIETQATTSESVTATETTKDALSVTEVSEEGLEPIQQRPGPSKAKRRRRSADTFIIDAQNVEHTPSPEAELPNIPARRSGRIKRRSIELYRSQIRKTLGEESPSPESKGQESPETPSTAKDVQDATSSLLSSVAERAESFAQSEESTKTPTERRSRRKSTEDARSAPATPESADVSINSSFGESPLNTPTSVAKGKGKRTKRKREPSVEDIYQNKLWRSQMPKDKNWETIFEEPKTKKGVEEYLSVKKFKRICNFDEFYNQNRLKRRRQKALKRGWKPLTKKKDEQAGKVVTEKLLALDQELIIEDELPNTSISETLALLGAPVESKSASQGETTVTASPTKTAVSSEPVASSRAGHKPRSTSQEIITSVKDPESSGEDPEPRGEDPEPRGEDPKQIEDDPVPSGSETSDRNSSMCDEKTSDSVKLDSSKSSESDGEFFTPSAKLFKPLKKASFEVNLLSAIEEDETDVFCTPNAPAAVTSSDAAKRAELPSQTEPEAELSGVFPMGVSP